MEANHFRDHLSISILVRYDDLMFPHFRSDEILILFSRKSIDFSSLSDFSNGFVFREAHSIAVDGPVIE